MHTSEETFSTELPIVAIDAISSGDNYCYERRILNAVKYYLVWVIFYLFIYCYRYNILQEEYNNIITGKDILLQGANQHSDGEDVEMMFQRKNIFNEFTALNNLELTPPGYWST